MYNRSRPRPKRMEFPFSGLIKCGICGMSVVGLTKIKPSGKSYSYYICSKRRGNCGQRGITNIGLEHQVIERLKAVTISERLWKICVKLLKESYGDQIDAQEKQKASWEQKRRLIEIKLRKLLDLRIDGAVGDDEYKSKRDELQEEKQCLNELISSAAKNNSEWLNRAEEFFSYAHSAYKIFDKGTISEKKELIGRVG